MQFEKCLTCPAIKEQRCAGPNFMSMPTKDVVEWMFAYMKLNHITNAQLAAVSLVPKGTIDGIKRRADIKHDTIYPLLKALIEMTGGKWGGEPCVATAGSSTDLEEENARLAVELKHTKDLLEEKIRELEARSLAIFSLYLLCGAMAVLLFLLILLNL